MKPSHFTDRASADLHAAALNAQGFRTVIDYDRKRGTYTVRVWSREGEYA